jgi:hypothetical protein
MIVDLGGLIPVGDAEEWPGLPLAALLFDPPFRGVVAVCPPAAEAAVDVDEGSDSETSVICPPGCVTS